MHKLLVVNSVKIISEKDKKKIQRDYNLNEIVSGDKSISAVYHRKIDMTKMNSITVLE